jgi:ATP-binding cassette subfamily B protein
MSLMMLSMTLMTLARAGASSERILEVLNDKVDIFDSPYSKEKNLTVMHGKVEFENVSFKYYADGSEYVLKDISFTILPGETVAIIGATGSAKTTLVQLIPRLYEVSKGRVLVDDTDVRDYTMQNLRKSVQLVLQQNELFSGTIRQNLKWGKPDASEEEILSAAEDSQAHDFIESLPKQYETVLGQSGVNLSGGQKQRLCIARALLRKPSILILDDSTSAVDTTTEAKIMEAFNGHLKNTTKIIIAQRISSIQSADKIILLDNGEIIGKGTHNDLMKDNPVYQEIYNSQLLQKENEL